MDYSKQNFCDAINELLLQQNTEGSKVYSVPKPIGIHGNCVVLPKLKCD